MIVTTCAHCLIIIVLAVFVNLAFSNNGVERIHGIGRRHTGGNDYERPSGRDDDEPEATLIRYDKEPIASDISNYDPVDDLKKDEDKSSKDLQNERLQKSDESENEKIAIEKDEIKYLSLTEYERSKFKQTRIGFQHRIKDSRKQIDTDITSSLHIDDTVKALGYVDPEKTGEKSKSEREIDDTSDSSKSDSFIDKNDQTGLNPGVEKPESVSGDDIVDDDNMWTDIVKDLDALTDDSLETSTDSKTEENSKGDSLDSSSKSKTDENNKEDSLKFLMDPDSKKETNKADDDISDDILNDIKEELSKDHKENIKEDNGDDSTPPLTSSKLNTESDEDSSIDVEDVDDLLSSLLDDKIQMSSSSGIQSSSDQSEETKDSVWGKPDLEIPRKSETQTEFEKELKDVDNIEKSQSSVKNKPEKKQKPLDRSLSPLVNTNIFEGGTGDIETNNHNVKNLRDSDTPENDDLSFNINPNNVGKEDSSIDNKIENTETLGKISENNFMGNNGNHREVLIVKRSSSENEDNGQNNAHDFARAALLSTSSPVSNVSSESTTVDNILTTEPMTTEGLSTDRPTTLDISSEETTTMIPATSQDPTTLSISTTVSSNSSAEDNVTTLDATSSMQSTMSTSTTPNVTTSTVATTSSATPTTTITKTTTVKGLTDNSTTTELTTQSRTQSTTFPTTTSTQVTTMITSPCASSPCNNNGSCLVAPSGGFTCRCRDPLYTGVVCETRLNPCDVFLCPSGASCVDLGNDRYCACPGNTKGQFCNETDELVQCGSDIERWHLLSSGDTIICFPLKSTTPNDSCYDKDDSLSYKLKDNLDMFYLLSNDTTSCLMAQSENVTGSVYYVTLTVYETDDLRYRPYRNDELNVNVIFNKAPIIKEDNSVVVNVNNIRIGYTLMVLSVDDMFGGTGTSFDITDASPPEYLRYVSVSASGEVQIQVIPDVNNSPLLVNLTIQVEDNGIPPLTSNTTAYIEFVNSTLLCSVPQTIYVDLPYNGTAVTTITCIGSETDNLHYTTGNSDLDFSVSDSGSVYINNNGSQLLRGKYNASIIVASNAVTTSTVSFLVLADKFIPECSPLLQTLEISENETVGSCFEVFRCTGPILYRHSCGSIFFDPAFTMYAEGKCMDNSTALLVEICLTKSLFGKGLVGTYMLQGSVSNTLRTTNFTMNVTVINVDEPPRFTILSHTAAVLENVPKNHPILQLTAEDPDPNDQLYFSIQEPNMPFQLDNSGLLSTSAKLNATKKDIYQFSVVVMDSAGLTDQATVTISVDDVDEPPICDPISFVFTMSATDVLGTVVGQLNCYDTDKNDRFRQFGYEINKPVSNDILDLFTVSSSGEISIIKNLTSSQSSYDFGIIVGNFTLVNISVIVNRNIPPRCQQKYVKLRLSEKALAGSCHFINSGCTDPLGGKLWYKAFGLNGTSYFDTPLPQNGSLALCTKSSLDRQYGDWMLDILVNNTYAVTQLLVIITVVDVNDAPQFTNLPYSFSILENEKAPAVVGFLHASDPDSGNFSDLSYSIGSKEFSLNSSTGLIETTKAMNASERTQYNFQAQVMDGGKLQDIANVTVNIKDLNDPPVCSAPNLKVDVSLVTSVGTVVGSLQCWDWDLDSINNTINYTIEKDSYGIFDIDGSGNITVKSSIPRDLNSYQLLVQVYDKWMQLSGTTGGFRVNIYVDVDRNIPPKCSATQLSGVFEETQLPGDCLGKEITCRDPTDGNITMGNLSGNGLDLVEIKSRPTTLSELPLSLCIKSRIKNKIGSYEIILKVSTNLGETEVKWQFRIIDVNEPPVFLNNMANVTVPETQRTGPIYTVQVIDPDSASPFNYVTLTNRVLDIAAGESISIAMLQNIFYVTGALNATKRNVYVFEVTATDGGNLSSTSLVMFNIEDVNERPVCDPNSYITLISLLTKVGEVLFEIFCYDTDKDTAFKTLTYISDSPYFNVTSDGKLIVASTLPRMQTSHNFRVRIIDQSSNPLSTAVSIIVNVNNTIQVQCQPNTNYPSIWVKDQCVNIEMNCVDPTKAGIDHLVYSVSGNYSKGFSMNNAGKGNYSFCYDRTDSNYYQVIVNVDNSLALYTRVFNIRVIYDQSTPKFLRLPYNTEINETAKVGSIVLKVEASAQGAQGNILYSLIGGSFSSWNDKFQIRSDNGQITTKTANLREYSTNTISVTVQALNDFSKLRSTAQVSVKIIDVNEPPICFLSSGLKVWKVNTTVSGSLGHILSTIGCTDIDVLPENKNLLYTLSVNPIEGLQYFGIMDNGQGGRNISIIKPLDVKTNRYEISINISDQGVPKQSDVLTLIVAVDLTPPAPILEAVAVNATTVEIRFRYDRIEFYDITRAFILNATSNNETNSFRVPANGTFSRSLLIKLKPDTNYSIILQANTDYGVVITSPVIVKTPAIPVISTFTCSVKMTGEDFNERYRDSGSFLYVSLSNKVNKGMKFILDRTAGFENLVILSFRPGSVIVDSLVSVNEQIGNVNDTVAALQNSVSSGWIGNITVDPNYFITGQGDGYIRIKSMVSNTTALYNGTYIKFTCYAEIVGNVGTLSYQWYLNNSLIRPTSRSKWQMANISTAATPKVYTLTVSPITLRDSGNIMCRVFDNQGLYSTSTVNIDVIAPPKVTIKPRFKTVTAGESVNISCFVTSPLSHIPTFVWYQDGSKLTTGNSIFNEGNFKQVLLIRNVQQTTRVTCEASNVAGKSMNMTAEIGAIQVTSEVCRSNEDSRKTVWEETVEGLVATKDCPVNYEGTATRSCLSGGVWAPPNYDDCVKVQLADIYQESEDLIQGIEKSSSEVVLESLANETDEADEPLTSSDLDISTLTLDNCVTVAKEKQADINIKSLNSVLQVVSNLVDKKYRDVWYNKIQREKGGASRVMKAATDYTKVATNQNSLKGQGLIQKKNLVAQVSVVQAQDVVFPDRSQPLPDWVKDKTTTVTLSKATLEAIGGSQEIGISNIYYRNVSILLNKYLATDSGFEDFNNSLVVNSDVVDISINQNYNGYLNPGVKLKFQNLNGNHSKAKCVFWDFDVAGTPDGAWSSTGCTAISTSEMETVCECNHLTNFAVLMSPGVTPDKDILALSIISAVGCGVSFIFLIITVVVYATYWRYVKSDRAIILMNLCVALIISYAVFLAGINRTEIEVVCTSVAMVLHYILLVVFFMMLAEGIEMAVSILYVFSTRSRVHWLMPLSWVLPAVIVGTSAGITKTEGYGNDRFCWLSQDNGLFYAFVGPALAVVITNTVILFLLLRAMFSSHMMMTKAAKEQVKSGVRSMSVILPVMGITWVFGIFSVNQDLVVFQYVFAIFNSFQGLFIFIFHCLLNRQIKDAMKHSRRRKRSLAELHSTRSTSQSTQKTPSTKESIDRIQNDIDKKANPFLEADRQAVQQIVDSKLKGEDNNAFTGAEKDKNIKKENIIGLEDVKISNILRQSEVSGSESSKVISGSSHIYDSVDRDSSHSSDSRKGRTVYTKLNTRDYDNRVDPSIRQQVPENDRYSQQSQGSYEKQNVGPRLSGTSSQTRTSSTTISTAASGSNQEYIDPYSRAKQQGRFSRSEEDLEYQSRDYAEAQYRGQQYQSRLQKKTYDPEPAHRKGMPHWGKAKQGAAAKKQQQWYKEVRHHGQPPDRGRRDNQPQAHQYDYYLGPAHQQPRHASMEDVSMQYMGYQPYGGIRNYNNRPSNNMPPEGWDYQVSWHEPHADYWH